LNLVPILHSALLHSFLSSQSRHISDRPTSKEFHTAISRLSTGSHQLLVSDVRFFV
jgi:hypothetical protein